MRLFTYQMPDELIAVAESGEFDEFDLNEFFGQRAPARTPSSPASTDAEVARSHPRCSPAHAGRRDADWHPPAVPVLRCPTPAVPPAPPVLVPPNVAAWEAMANLLAEKQNVFWHDYKVLAVAGPGAGIGLDALP